MAEIPTHTSDGLELSRWGRIATYAQKEVNSVHRELVFSRLKDEKELIKRLTTIIDNIKLI